MIKYHRLCWRDRATATKCYGCISHKNVNYTHNRPSTFALITIEWANHVCAWMWMYGLCSYVHCLLWSSSIWFYSPVSILYLDPEVNENYDSQINYWYCELWQLIQLHLQRAYEGVYDVNLYGMRERLLASIWCFDCADRMK